jgi:biofilm PGA synthesis N-glycosyltransferase PgaC
VIVVFIAASLFVVYVLFGYPVLLWILNHSRGTRPVRKELQPLTVSVLLPVRNGERWVRQKLESIIALDYPRELVEIIVVSDGSTDGSAAIAGEFAAFGVRLTQIPASGKAVALNTALQQATGEILLYTDVRQRLAPDSLRHLVACFADPKVGVVSGELVILEGETLEESSVGLYWKYEKWIRKGQSAMDSILGATGAIYAVRRSLAGPLPPGTLLDDVHQPLAAFFQGYRVILDEAAKAYDFPTSLHSEFHRKVRTQAGMYQIIRRYPGLLGFRNRMWIHFVSHKLGRMLMPVALIAIFISAFWLPGPWAPVAVIAQIGFYALAVIDRWIPEGVLAKRGTSPIRTFAVLMAAAFFAPFGALSSADRVWKQTEVSGSPGPANSWPVQK